MIWVIQQNLWSEPEYRKFIDIMNRSGIPTQSVEVRPFSHEIIPKVEYEGKKIAYGSTTMMKVTIQEKWNPGCYYNEKFDFRYWVDGYKDDLLNYDGTVCQFKDVPTNLEDIFIRPCADLKEFTGLLINKKDFAEWKDLVLNLDSESTLNEDTWVTYASPKEIYKEYRFFIVDNKICTYSTYRINGWLDTKLPVEDDAIEFVQKMIDKWSPHKVFVLDVALTSKGYKVIEINCVNSSGFYNCDISKLVQTIWEMES